MYGRMIRIRATAFLMVLTLGALSLSAQEITGTISGTVVDSSGAVIPDANVTVTNKGTQAVRSTTTTSAGVFFFTGLPIGDYSLIVSKEGFKRYTQSGIHLDVNGKVALNIALQVGAPTQEVTVIGEAPTLSTATALISNLVGETQTQALPLNGRAFNQLVDLVPGVAPDSGRVGGGLGTSSDTAMSVNGNQSNSNVFLIDGLYDEDNGSNANLLVTPSVDSLAEFNILRNNYSAEFGGGTGAIVNVITKSGTRTIHGSLFEFLRNDKLDAADFFLNSTGGQKSKLRLNNFGGTIGGPFWLPGHYNQDKTKDFFFISQEFRREVRGNVATDTVPSARQARGILDPNCQSTSSPCTVQPADPFEATLSGEANVDPSQIDPNAAAILARLPLPNANFAVNGFNWIASEPTVTNVNDATYRWDHNIGEKTRIMLRYIGMNLTQAGINAQNWGDDNWPSVNSDWQWVGRHAVLDVTNTLSPRLVNDFEGGYAHNHIIFATGKSSDPKLASRSGFTYSELFPATSGSFPTVSSVEAFGSGSGNLLAHQAPFFNKTDNWMFKDDLSSFFGKHNLKVGFNLLLLRKDEPANGGGNFNAGTLSFNTFEDMLLGNIATYSEEETLNRVRGHYKNLALYVQDDYKARRNLTLNLGLRWQYLSPIRAADQNIGNFDPGLYNPSQCAAASFSGGLVDPTLCNVVNGIITPAKTSGVDEALVNRHFNEWEPRIGLAWVPLSGYDRLVIRSGFGIYHGRDAGSQTSSLGQFPPFDHIPRLSNISFSQLAPFNPSTPQPPVELSALDLNYSSPESYQYSTGIQWEIVRGTTVEINFVGSRQIHLGRNRDINQVAPQYQLPVFWGEQSATPPPDIVPIGDPNSVRPFLGYSIINLNERAGSSRYDSLQAFVNHRVDRIGLQLQAAYTFGRNVTDANNQDSEGHSNPVQDAYHPELNRGVAAQNQPHSFVLNYVWGLPFYRNAQGLRGIALGGWQLVGITTFRTGLPLTVCEDRDINGTLSEACQRPDLVSNPNLAKGKRTLGEFFDTSAFVLQPLGTFGNSGIHNIVGPGINNWDFSIFKDFKIPWFGKGGNSLAAESANLQFRAEFFNLFNHTQFSGVNTTFVPQVDANGVPLVGLPADPSSGFGSVTGARPPREIQFALKFTF
ncbi:MAG TPA: carboxypeptidase regulatory-like domain-containing protein [Acidobacteriota bacterium]|nr:carboxypeptidase regulatory-like domain-containing protein [Acidobacteriota bacterium]